MKGPSLLLRDIPKTQRKGKAIIITGNILIRSKLKMTEIKICGEKRRSF